MDTRERLRFESWIRSIAHPSIGKDLTDESLKGRYNTKDNNEYIYDNMYTQLRWKAWQAYLTHPKELNEDQENE